MRRASLGLPGLLLTLLLVSGCSDLPYYWQAGMGQLEIINKRRGIDMVLADATVPDETKRKLRLIRAVQTFATGHLALPDDGHYRYYADLGRPFVSWLVVASPPLELKEHRFCYLIVGCLGYRGYFDPEDAKELAEELRGEEMLDVMVRPVRAYSTLGWFDDPVLNTFLNGEDVILIGTVLHELTHRRFFLEGDTAFNESFATFVEVEGARRYLTRFEDPAHRATLERYLAIRADRERFNTLLRGTRDALQALYASDRGAEAKLEEKRRLIAELREDFQARKDSFTILRYEGWFQQPLNNAHFVGLSHYTLHVRAFEALFHESGGDFRRFYAAVESLAELPQDERKTRLAALENKLVAERHTR